MIYLTDLSKKIIKDFGKINLAIDMTCGNGNDTLFLAKIAKKVYSFDIQSLAISNTKVLIKGYKNVKLIKDNHINIDKYIKDKIDVVIYNLGYLPGGDKEIATTAKSTIISLKKILTLLNEKALIIIEVYPHNPDEIRNLLAFTKTINNNYDVIKLDLHNKNNSPFLLIISKNINI
ncbi:MAG: tRNA (mnm(5)s(2)U34)-methyltransferase [Bacillota bacterium]